MNLKKNIPHSEESALDVFLLGEENLRKKHQNREKEKLGHLRIGNAGCMVSENTCIGACPQTTLARFLGYQLPTEASTGYFDGGVANEEIWIRNVTEAGVEFKCEEDIPILQKIGDTVLSGRPDMVLGDTIEKHQKYTMFEPRLMIELKACQATNSAASKLLLDKPDGKHLIQAATYSMFLGIPAVLVYTSNISGGITNYFTKRETGGQDATFGKIEFKLGWDDGKLYYMKGDIRIDTIVTQQGIIDFYSNIAKMAKEKKPNLIYQDMVDIEGEMLPYNPRSYSDLVTLIDDNLPFDEWKEKLELVCNQEYLIKYKKKKYEIVHPTYEVETYKYFKIDKHIKSFETLNAARRYIYELKGQN